MDTVVDNLELPNERLAWIQAAEDLKKPVYLRTELEVSRILTLMSRLAFFQPLTFQQRFTLTKVARFRKVVSGVVLFETPEGVSGGAAVATSGGDLSQTSPPSVNLLGSSSKASPVGSPGLVNFLAPPAAASGSATTRIDHDSSYDRSSEIHVVVFGTVMLRVPQPQGISQTVVDKGEPIGTSLVAKALPPKSQYVTTEPVELLTFSADSIREHLARLEEIEVQQRKSFFQNLTVPILATWQEEQFEQLARSVYPIRLLSRELVIREGTEASAAYFISTGKLKVVREIDFSHVSVGTGGNGGSAPSVKLLELATLAEGEFFGELALLRHQVDSTKKVKLSKLTSEMNFGAKKDNSVPPPPPPPFGKLGTRALSKTLVVGSSSDESDDEDFRTLRPEKPSITRQATVYAHTPSTLYVLPRLQFMALMTGSALVRLREYAKGYPSQQEIRNHFSKQQKWEDFKTQLVAQVRSSASSTHGPKRK